MYLYILTELSDHDYWVGANDTETEGEWAWLDGTPVRMGTPLWALYRYSSNDYEQVGLQQWLVVP